MRVQKTALQARRGQTEDRHRHSGAQRERRDRRFVRLHRAAGLRRTVRRERHRERPARPHHPPGGKDGRARARRPRADVQGRRAGRILPRAFPRRDAVVRRVRDRGRRRRALPHLYARTQQRARVGGIRHLPHPQVHEKLPRGQKETHRVLQQLRTHLGDARRSGQPLAHRTGDPPCADGAGHDGAPHPHRRDRRLALPLPHGGLRAAAGLPHQGIPLLLLPLRGAVHRRGGRAPRQLQPPPALAHGIRAVRR